MKLRDLLQKKNKLVQEAKDLIAQDKIEEAKAKNAEIAALNEKIEAMVALQDEEEKNNLEDEEEEITPTQEQPENKSKEAQTAAALRATIKAVMGKRLTSAEAALVTPGTNGEGYILPQDIRTKIVELQRQYKSMRTILGYMPTSDMSGSFPVEDFTTVSELIDFDDNDEMNEADDIKFKNVPFALKNKGAIIILGNTLLKKTDNDLINYVAKVFARKAVITENKMAFAKLDADKTKVAIADWKALSKAYNTKIDEGVKFGAVIVTNQDGFDVLDAALDSQGRPVLQPDPTQPTRKLFKGVPVEVFSNALLPTTGTTTKKAPLYLGNLEMAAQFVDDGFYEFASSSHAGFTKNVTIARVIEHVDVIKTDGADEVYIVGELTVV